MGAGGREDALHTRTRIWRAADHLRRLSLTYIYDADPQPVGVWMLFTGNDLAHHERPVSCGWIMQLFQFEAERSQLIGDRVDWRIGLQMILQPAEGELHGVSPRSKVGTSNGTKP